MCFQINGVFICFLSWIADWISSSTFRPKLSYNSQHFVVISNTFSVLSPKHHSTFIVHFSVTAIKSLTVSLFVRNGILHPKYRLKDNKKISRKHSEAWDEIFQETLFLYYLLLMLRISSHLFSIHLPQALKIPDPLWIRKWNENLDRWKWAGERPWKLLNT